MNTSPSSQTQMPPSINLGDDEVWKHCPHYPGFAASNYGRIKALEKPYQNQALGYEGVRKERLLICNKQNRDGYLVHTITGPVEGKTSYLAHRVVAMTWIDNPSNKRFVNHINGIKTDNRVDNLEWVTKSENGIHAVKTGLHTALRGEINGNSKLTPSQVIEIRELEGLMGDRAVAKKFKIGRTTVSYIWKRKLWAHL